MLNQGQSEGDVKQRSIQDTFLSLELKSELKTEVWFNIVVRQVISFNQGNSFCFCWSMIGLAS